MKRQTKVRPTPSALDDAHLRLHDSTLSESRFPFGTDSDLKLRNATLISYSPCSLAFTSILYHSIETESRPITVTLSSSVQGSVPLLFPLSLHNLYLHRPTISIHASRDKIRKTQCLAAYSFKLTMEYTLTIRFNW